MKHVFCILSVLTMLIYWVKTYNKEKHKSFIKRLVKKLMQRELCVSSSRCRTKS